MYWSDNFLEQEIIDVNMGEFTIASNSQILRSEGVGSCLVITFYDRNLKLGALSHPMLPKKPLSLMNESSSKYVDSSIKEVLDILINAGIKLEQLEVKLIGANNILNSGNYCNIANENLATAQDIMQELGINVLDKMIGGSVGQSVEFSIKTGLVTVKSIF